MDSQNKAKLNIKPQSHLKFEGPYDKVATSYLELTNPSSQQIAYKIKTTAPRHYCVRPNTGIVEARSDVKIAIMLQPIDTTKTSFAELEKHKFMVQYVNYPVDDSKMTLEKLWTSVDDSLIESSRVRCWFDQSYFKDTPDATQPQNQSQPIQWSTLKKVHPASDSDVLIAKTQHQSPQEEHEFQRHPTTLSQSVYADKSSASEKSLVSDQANRFSLLVAFVVLVIGFILGKYVF